MKIRIYTLFWVIVVTVIVAATAAVIKINTGKVKPSVPPIEPPIEQTEQGLSAWEMLTLAIIKTESGFDSTAVRGDCKGIFQLRPIYIKECNRLVGYEKYTHDDAFSVEKSLEMFNLIQEHYNPEHDADYAIKLHNPTADIVYADRVMRNFREIVRQQEIINQIK